MYIPDKAYGKPNLGRNVRTTGPVNYGSEPYLVTIGDDTTISFDCAFVTHDAATRVIRNLDGQNPETVIYKPITVGRNCFIGAGSIVNKDIPSNIVAAGAPCRVICTLEEYIEKHMDEFMYIVSMPYNEKRKYLMKYFGLDNK